MSLTSCTCHVSCDTPQFPVLTPILAKATDENLTSEDWGAIIEVCDKVTSDSNGPNQAVQAMIKRLAHRNANVQLYTLEVSPRSPGRARRSH